MKYNIKTELGAVQIHVQDAWLGLDGLDDLVARLAMFLCEIERNNMQGNSYSNEYIQ